MPALAAPSDTEALLEDPFTLPAGVSFTVTFAVSVTSPLPGGVDSVQNQAVISGDNFTDVLSVDPSPHVNFPPANDETITPLTVPVDLEVAKDDAQTTAVPGTPVTYTIVVSNNGPNDIVNATVSDSFPADLTGVNWTCAAGPGGACTFSGSGDVSDTVDLVAGSSVTYTVNVTIDSAATGTLINTVTVSGNSYNVDPSPGDNSATDTDTLTPEVDVTLAKSDSADPVAAGSGAGNLTYVIATTNAGPSDAINVTIGETLALPAGVSVESMTPSAGSFVSPTWTIPDLDVGQSETLTVLLTVDATAAAGSDVISDTATVTGADQTLVNTSDNSAAETASVDTTADLVVAKSDNPDPAVAGEPLTYTIAITNNGPSDAQGVLATDTFTDALTLDSTFGCAEDPGGAPTCSLGAIPAGGTARYTITAVVDSATLSTTITSTVTVATTTAEAVPGDESAAITTTVHVIADLELSKVDHPDPVLAGEALTYTLTLTNHGPSQGWGVMVRDRLPLAYNHTGNDCGVSYSRPDPFEWVINDMPAGTVLTCVITGTVDPGVSGTITNTADASTISFVTDPDPNNDSLDEPTTVYDTCFDIGSVSRAEGDAGITPFTFTITRTSASTAATVDYATANAGQDHIATSGTVTFTAAGSLTRTVTISVTGDTLDENDETFVVNLSNPGSDAIGDGQGVGTILDDDAPPQLSVDDPAVVDFSSAVYAVEEGAGTATAGDDYASISDTVAIPAGETTASLTVPILSDDVDERDETVQLTLNDPANALLASPITATLTTDDDDATVIFLPLSFRNVIYLPDLVVETLEVGDDGVNVVVVNQGNRTVATPFWVDVYLDPDRAPTSVNQTWPQVAEEGMAWGVTAVLVPGEALTLTVGGPYFRPDASNFSGNVSAGTLVYAQADSANAGVPYGAVLECHERQGGPYNNIVGPVAAPTTLMIGSPRFGRGPDQALPPRR